MTVLGMSESVLIEILGTVFVGMIVITLVLIWKKLSRRASNKPAKSTPKPQGPTEEELLLAMSNTELLRELIRLQRTMIKTQQNHFRFARLGIFSFFLALFSDGE